LIEFTKVHGNGNDFIVLENLGGGYSSEELARLARLLCRRGHSLGADGVLAVEPGGDGFDFTMRLFNADGSEAEMCGNGARALARYAFEKKLAGASMSFSTLAGPVRAQVEPPHAELDMGNIPLGKECFGGTMESWGFKFPYLFLTVGVPHCVLFMEDYDELDDDIKAEIGAEVSHDFSLFPNGTNVTFVQRLARNEARAVTYERGVEELTESCGTGCVAAAIALEVLEQGAPERAVRVQNPGGLNEVRLNFASGGASCHARLKGRTALVAEGRVLEDALFEELA
jgi:diaminopimelate epimerase